MVGAGISTVFISIIIHYCVSVCQIFVLASVVTVVLFVLIVLIVS